MKVLNRLAGSFVALIAGSSLAMAATASLNIDEDNGGKQEDYAASNNEYLKVYYDSGTECHVWGKGVIQTSNAFNWGRLSWDDEIHDGEIVDADPPEWRVSLTYKWWVKVQFSGSVGAQDSGAMAKSYLLLTGDILAVKGVSVAGGNRVEINPATGDPYTDVPIQSGLTIPQRVITSGAITSDVVLTGPNMVYALPQASLDFTMEQRCDLQMQTPGGSRNVNRLVECQENSSTRNSFYGTIEAWNTGPDPDVMIESWTVE